MKSYLKEATHYRFNKKRPSKINLFKVEDSKIYILVRDIWELTSGEVLQGASTITNDIINKIINREVFLTTSTKSYEADKEPKQKSSSKSPSFAFNLKEPTYDPVIPLLSEEVMEYVPKEVLRELVAHYKTADVVDITISIKTSHTIKG